MIVLDTNVVSEILKPTPEPAVIAWLDTHADEPLVLTAITKAELLYGVATMPDGRRRRSLADELRAIFGAYEATHILPFDSDAAEEYARITAERERRGRPISVIDTQIAAVCASHDLSLATRNVRDFELTGVTVVDPWRANT